MAPRVGLAPWSLYATDGERKYLNEAERGRVLGSLGVLQARERLFVLTLAWIGARISECLALTPASFQIEYCTVSVVTLKRRCFVVREVPIPPWLMHELDEVFQLHRMQSDAATARVRMWPWHRVTAWRLIKRVTRLVGIVGVRASPRGLRHAFGVATLRARVPPNVRQKWLGHSRPETTNIYSAVCGPDEMCFAEQFWRETPVQR